MDVDPWGKLKPAQQALVDGYVALLDDDTLEERAYQDYFERFPELIPTPWILGHRLHTGSIISKLPVGNYFCDFAYLTKHSARWYLVLVEIERPDKPVLTKDGQLSAHYTTAKRQLLQWKGEISKVGTRKFVQFLDPLLRPLARNPIDVRYVLMMGRDADLVAHGPDARQMINDDLGPDSVFATFDTPGTHYMNDGRHWVRPNILTASGAKLAYKHLHHEPEGMFSYVEPHELELTAAQEAQLVTWGYDIDAWKKGKLLILNNKSSAPRQSVTDFLGRALKDAAR